MEDPSVAALITHSYDEGFAHCRNWVREQADDTIMGYFEILVKGMERPDDETNHAITCHFAMLGLMSAIIAAGKIDE